MAIVLRATFNQFIPYLWTDEFHPVNFWLECRVFIECLDYLLTQGIANFSALLVQRRKPNQDIPGRAKILNGGAGEPDFLQI